jgi:putative toxin-antitoxin system antitoxin component (TIGR02293 family)
MQGEKSTALNQKQNGSTGPANVVFRTFKASQSIETRTVITLFGREIKNQDIISKVRVGLPIKSIDRVAKKMELLDVVFVLRFIGMSDRTYQRRKNENKALSSIQSDRLYRLAKVEALAVDVLGDEKTASDWMKTPNRALGAAPLDLLDTEAGKDQVERVLTRIEYGVYS